MTAPLSIAVEIPGDQLEAALYQMVLQEISPEVGRFERGGQKLRAEVFAAVKRAVEPAILRPMVAEIVQAAIDTKLRKAISDAVDEELGRLAKRAAKEAVRGREGEAVAVAQALLPMPQGGVR